MDFARKQLEKYGWTDGKGLGKNENGISEALKPKLKRSVAGIGHDAAADFTEHWWKQLYDKAAQNVQVEEKDGKTKKIKTKDNQFKITNNTYHLTKKSDSNREEYSDFFVRTAVLTSGGSRIEKFKESDSEEEEEKKDVHKMTDEELFAVCEGRTAHKGARHGLTALGKLARIERQEQMLLTQPKYNGYSHSKNNKKVKNLVSEQDIQVVEYTNLNEEDGGQVKKKKKKRKQRLNNEKDAETVDPLPEKIDVDMTENKSASSKKSKKSKRKKDFLNEELYISKPKQKKTIQNDIDVMDSVTDTMSEDLILDVKKSKKKKKF